MQYSDLITVSEQLAVHLGRSQYTIAAMAGVHSRLFKRLREGGGCRVDTFNQAMHWFDANWPADLAWPRDITRRSRSSGVPRDGG